MLYYISPKMLLEKITYKVILRSLAEKNIWETPRQCAVAITYYCKVNYALEKYFSAVKKTHLIPIFSGRCSSIGMTLSSPRHE